MLGAIGLIQTVSLNYTKIFPIRHLRVIKPKHDWESEQKGREIHGCFRFDNKAVLCIRQQMSYGLGHVCVGSDFVLLDQSPFLIGLYKTFV